MPAQKKVTREAIIKAAYELLRKSGIETVNARSIAKKLGCSTQPIYHAFAGMDELKAELALAAEARHNAEVRLYMEKSEYTPYLAYGMGFVFLAKKERELFRFLFMTGNGEERKVHQPANISDVLRIMRDDYGYSCEAAAALHEDMTIYAYGLALGMNTGIFDMTEREIAEHFKTEFAALTGVYGVPTGMASPADIMNIEEKNKRHTHKSLEKKGE